MRLEGNQIEEKEHRYWLKRLNNLQSINISDFYQLLKQIHCDKTISYIRSTDNGSHPSYPSQYKNIRNSWNKKECIYVCLLFNDQHFYR